MECTHAIALLNAQLDQAMPPEDLPKLEAHLNGCASCRATAEALRRQDASLRRAFASRRSAIARVADRARAQIQRESFSRPTRRNWWFPAFGVAAGFLLAWMVLRPGRTQPEPAKPSGVSAERISELLAALQKHHGEDMAQLSEKLTGENRAQLEKIVSALQAEHEKQMASALRDLMTRLDKPELQLVLATGLVEAFMPGADAWRPVPRGGKIEPGQRIRTDPKVRCELRTADGSEIRLNNGTEILFNGMRQMELTRGQLWVRVAKDPTPFQVLVADATVTALGTEFDLMRRQADATLTVLEGMTKVEGKGAEQIVRSGEYANIVDGKVTEKHKRQLHDLVMATRWVHELLMLKGRDDKELSKRVDDLFAQIGDEKTGYLTEEEIRALGDHGVLPLTRFLQSDRSHGTGSPVQSKRNIAGRILADLAPPWAIPDMISLLDHPDGEVRYYAAPRGLQRLTSQTQGKRPDEWRQQSPAALKQAREQWNDWWQHNKDKYPGAS